MSVAPSICSAALLSSSRFSPLHFPLSCSCSVPSLILYSCHCQIGNKGVFLKQIFLKQIFLKSVPSIFIANSFMHTKLLIVWSYLFLHLNFVHNILRILDLNLKIANQIMRRVYFYISDGYY